MKVSFDFDGCLDIDVIGDYAKELVERGVDVWVVTARVDNMYGSPNWNDDLFDRVSKLGISLTKIVFTNMQKKEYYFKDSDFIWHLDDDWQAVKEINSNTTVKAITNFGNETWKEDCEKILSENLDN